MRREEQRTAFRMETGGWAGVTRAVNGGGSILHHYNFFYVFQRKKVIFPQFIGFPVAFT